MRLAIIFGLAVLALSGCDKNGDGRSITESSEQARAFRYRWVCESGHTVKQTGPYKSTYDAAAAGGKAHDDAEHEGFSAATVETSYVP